MVFTVAAVVMWEILVATVTGVEVRNLLKNGLRTAFSSQNACGRTLFLFHVIKITCLGSESSLFQNNLLS